MEEMRKQVLQMQEEAKKISMLQSQVVEQMQKPKGVAVDAEKVEADSKSVFVSNVRSVQVTATTCHPFHHHPSIGRFPHTFFYL